MKKWLYLSVTSFFLSSMIIWFMSYEALRLILGIVFWLGLIAGFVFMRPVSKARNADREYNGVKSPPFLRFFSNKPALIFDILLFISLTVTVISFSVTSFPQILSSGGVFGFVFSLEMHGVFNGNNYMYIREEVPIRNNKKSRNQ
ncbi:MAG: hypothetical protein FWF94_07930 [Oscillospiraceae bacterium]|nr:hypothetical protein [Oscillospiraceae bacterium]